MASCTKTVSKELHIW